MVAGSMIFALCFAVIPGTITAAQADSPNCTNSTLPVALGPGQPLDQKVGVTLCLPSGATPHTVQVLVPGCLWNDSYWNFPSQAGDPNDYSFVDSAINKDYATLSFNMVGEGDSSHPASTALNVYSDAYIIHEVIQYLTYLAPGASLPSSGIQGITGVGILGPHGQNVTFTHQLEVSWSFGTMISWLEVSDYNDVTAAAFTSATHNLNVSWPFLNAILSLYPAALDPQFAGNGYDLAYETMSPSSLTNVFFGSGQYDPAVAAYAGAHSRDLMTATELATFPLAIAQPLNIKVPVFDAIGANDPLFCGSSATNCSSGAALAAQEAPHLGSSVPSVTGYVSPNTGHAINLSSDSPAFFSALQSWALSTVAPMS